jgi:hypothetical protein
MDHTLLAAIVGGVTGGLLGLILVFAVGWVQLAFNARGFTEIT